MRLLFERGFAPTHAFVQFYLWLRNTFDADAVLHFGMHGALEFMPGKQAGLGARDWPDRLIGEMPNVYLYAANNPSEATLAKRRSGAVTITHMTPPLAASGLYKGLAELKDSLTRWRAMAPDAPERADLELLIAEQADAVDMGGKAPDDLWLTLLETEDALIPEGLHVVGRADDGGAARTPIGRDGRCRCREKALAPARVAAPRITRFRADARARRALHRRRCRAAT
jgi:magnesium chelatase subunit H